MSGSEFGGGIYTCLLCRVPVQYILGEWDFRHVTLAMRPPVFVPTAETEVRREGGREGAEEGGRGMDDVGTRLPYIIL